MSKKSYKRKIHLNNSCLDIDSSNKIRKSINSSYRQTQKNIIQESTEGYYSRLEDEDWGFFQPYGYEYWRYINTTVLYTIGGKFITTLVKLDILSGPKSIFYNHPHEELLRKLSSSPSGIIA